MIATELMLKLGLSAALGLLVGLQRERTESSLAGIRTFPLIALFGTMCGLLALSFGGWVVAAGLLSLTALFVIGNLMRLKGGDIDPGLTTELAAILLYGAGAYLVVGDPLAAVVLCGGMALLLQFKKPMEAFAAGIEEKDIHAVMQFVLVTLVILPVLPNRPLGPHDTLNPFKIWLFVVLIVGLSLGAYVLYKMLGAKAGMIWGGILGGFISSTATTVSFARRTGDTPGAGAASALVIMLASTVLYVRILIVIAAVAPGLLSSVGPPLGAMFVICSLICLLGYHRVGKHSTLMPLLHNPAALKSALILGALYAVTNLAVGVAKERLGTSGLYGVAVVAGLTDVDAVTISTAQLAGGGGVEVAIAWRVILLATLSNLVFKAGIIATLGSRDLLKQVGILFGLTLASGGALLVLWPK